MLSRRETYA